MNVNRTELADNRSLISSWLESVILFPFTARISSPERKYALAAAPPGEQNFTSTEKIEKLKKSLLWFLKSSSFDFLFTWLAFSADNGQSEAVNILALYCSLAINNELWGQCQPVPPSRGPDVVSVGSHFFSISMFIIKLANFDDFSVEKVSNLPRKEPVEFPSLSWQYLWAVQQLGCVSLIRLFSCWLKQ